jgi:hypothetical protein
MSISIAGSSPTPVTASPGAAAPISRSVSSTGNGHQAPIASTWRTGAMAPRRSFVPGSRICRKDNLLDQKRRFCNTLRQPHQP